MLYRLLSSQIISCFGHSSSYFLNLARLLLSSRIVHNIYQFRFFTFSNYDLIFSLIICFGVIMRKHINNYLIICLNCIILFKNVSFFELPPKLLTSQGKVELIKYGSIFGFFRIY